MPIRKYEAVSETTEGEVVALKLKHKCQEYGRTFPKQKGLDIRRARWCHPEGPKCSRKGSLADEAVKRTKRNEQAAQLLHVYIHDHQLENVVTFDYLGCRISGDGDDSADIKHHMCWHKNDSRSYPTSVETAGCLSK